MSPAELTTYVRWKCRCNSTTFTDAEILALLKLRADEISRRILDADEDTFVLPQYATLVANQREYALPAETLARLKRVEAKLNGSDWIKLTEMDLNQYGYATNEDTITDNFTNEEGEAFYDITRKSLWIYSGTITDVTDGLKLWCNTYPAEITDLTLTTDMSADPTPTTHGLPREFHELLCRGIIIDYKESREKPIPLTERELSYETDIQKAIHTLRHGNLDREVIGGLPSATTRGNDGSNY